MARPITTEPTSRHIEILHAITELAQENTPPVISDIARKLKTNVSSLRDVLQVMKRMNLVETTRIGRGILVSLTPVGQEASGVPGIPLFGTIPAGNLSAVEGVANFTVTLKDLFPYQQGDFLLKVEGESMTGVGILPGDTVLMRPNVQPQQGEITAVLVGTEQKATLKRFYWTKKEVRLEAANSAFPDQIVRHEEVRIAGVFQALIRHRNGMGINTP